MTMRLDTAPIIALQRLEPHSAAQKEAVELAIGSLAQVLQAALQNPHLPHDTLMGWDQLVQSIDLVGKMGVLFQQSQESPDIKIDCRFTSLHETRDPISWVQDQIDYLTQMNKARDFGEWLNRTKEQRANLGQHDRDFLYAVVRKTGTRLGIKMV